MSPSSKLIEQCKDILGGTPVFKGTHVPVKTFIEYLEANHSIQDFLEDFPTVSLQNSIEVLETLKSS